MGVPTGEFSEMRAQAWTSGLDGQTLRTNGASSTLSTCTVTMVVSVSFPSVASTMIENTFCVSKSRNGVLTKICPVSGSTPNMPVVVAGWFCMRSVLAV